MYKTVGKYVISQKCFTWLHSGSWAASCFNQHFITQNSMIHLCTTLYDHTTDEIKMNQRWDFSRLKNSTPILGCWNWNAKCVHWNPNDLNWTQNKNTTGWFSHGSYLLVLQVDNGNGRMLSATSMRFPEYFAVLGGEMQHCSSIFCQWKNGIFHQILQKSCTFNGILRAKVCCSQLRCTFDTSWGSFKLIWFPLLT